MIKVAIITCYKDPDYVRSRSLRRALTMLPRVELFIVKNKSRNFWRYPDVLWQLIKLRIKFNPEVYLLTFRGYEILPFVLLITVGKRLIFDEFINLTEWVVDEHQKIPPNSYRSAIFNYLYSLLLARCDLILTDTVPHAEYSAKLSGVPLEKYTAVPVSTDEELFKYKASEIKKNPFVVFYYGSMLPLHGVPVVLEAAKLLASENHVKFLLVGGNAVDSQDIPENIQYLDWIQFKDLPCYISSAGVCLGGPFGNTRQSQFVITGKTYQFLAMGAPTIVGASLASELFIDRKNCLLVPQGDAVTLAEQILWAYRNQESLRDIGDAGYLLYQQAFSNHQVSLKLETILSS